jgi:ElaB/YqjD/DUF883 family membrane-anchored ribosome-binding protein
MSENKSPGSAGPALAAHSKDASVPGQTPASSTAGHQDPPRTGEFGQTLREGAEAARETIRDAAENTRAILSERGGRAAGQTADMVREQPFVAMAITGVACLAIGILIGRR